MSDRELLEMATKAAGYDGLRWSMLRQCFYDCSGIYWRPLDDDGDALRLAVKLQLQIRPNGYDVMVVARLPSHIAIAEACDHKDPYAAIRRAIVRAAAEIGRGMK